MDLKVEDVANLINQNIFKFRTKLQVCKDRLINRQPSAFRNFDGCNWRKIHFSRFSLLFSVTGGGFIN